MVAKYLLLDINLSEDSLHFYDVTVNGALRRMLYTVTSYKTPEISAEWKETLLPRV